MEQDYAENSSAQGSNANPNCIRSANGQMLAGASQKIHAECESD